MHVESLRAVHFRNLETVTVDAHRRLNVFLGPNGQGKTNLLEAVHLVSALRPLRHLERGRDLIRFGESHAQLTARLELDGPLDVDVDIEPSGRRARLAGKVVRDIGEIARRVRVVAFTPEDLTIVRGAPAERRRAVDRFAFALDAGFATLARRYDAALERRNRLLRARVRDEAQVAAYTDPLVEAGARLVRARALAVHAWASDYREAVTAVSHGELSSTIGYASSLGHDVLSKDGSVVDEAELRSRFTEALRASADEEQRRHMTMRGPHKDDLVIALAARGARHFASQGEARALVLALKIASVRALTRVHGTAPLLLLDDVAGELDPVRAGHLFSLLDEVDTQAFVTATHRELLVRPGAYRAFEISTGRVAAVHDHPG